MFHRVQVNRMERGLLFRARDFVRLLEPGVHVLFGKVRVDVISLEAPIIEHPQMNLLREAGALAGVAEFVTVKDTQRALLFEDGRFLRSLAPGVYAVRQVPRAPKVEIVEVPPVPLFEHPDAVAIAAAPGSAGQLEVATVEPWQQAALYASGRLERILAPGVYVFFRNVAKTRVVPFDMREQILEVSGQDILTADRVTIRVSALLNYRVVNLEKALSAVSSPSDSLYREAQLALRAAIGRRELEALLADKDAVLAELAEPVATRAEAFGIDVRSFGIRDLILPGDMRELLNKVVAAKKEAEASLITRREETAELRHQANSARLFESNPVLLRLREIEAAERIAAKASITIVGNGESAVQQLVKLV